MKLSKLTENKSIYEAYKYVIQDTGNIYIGAKYTYDEIMNNAEIPFKLKAVISQYISKDTSMENSLESHLYYLEKNCFSYETYEQLKCRVKTQILFNKKNIFGRTKTIYIEKIYKLDEITDINLAKKKGAGMVITEIIISKLALMSFTV